MFGLQSRPSRRPFVSNRTPARSMLRVEALESRTNPAGPVLSNLAATWSDTTHVVVTGQVIDQNPTAVWVNGGGRGAAFVSNQGAFRIALTTNGIDPIHVQAEDTESQYSTDMMCAYGAGPVATTGNSPVVGGVTVTKDGDTWHIRGTSTGSAGADTIIRIISSNPDLKKEVLLIDQNGFFDIAITLNPNSPGGDIGIVSVDPGTNEISDVQWEGTID